MDLNWHLQQLPHLDIFERFELYWDLDPEDEKTPGWTASVLIKDDDGDDSYIQGNFDLTPQKAYEGLLETLIKDGYVDEDVVYGRR